ncbi:MAG: tRNA (adenosine(37)-N6)-threonylcarbamoyltransferase complex dimerization subunit type 1 TsaB [Pseudomonadota bacterium]
MSILAIDTCANFCAAAVFDSKNRLQTHLREDIGRGHAAHLLPIVEQVLDRASCSFGDLTKVIVALGPGSFTGIRVGVAAARGYGVALSVPVEGFSTFALLAAEAKRETGKTDMIVSIKGGRGQLFNQHIAADGSLSGAPLIHELHQLDHVTLPSNACLVGNGALLLDPKGQLRQVLSERATGDLDYALEALMIDPRAPEPLYIRGADAKPQTGFALPRTMENT